MTDKSESKSPNEEKKEAAIVAKQHKGAETHELYALIIGYNELAKNTGALGERVYFRLCRDHALKCLQEAGGEMTMTNENDVVLTLRDKPPYVKFRSKDIELMRKCVAEFDAESKKSPTDG